MTIEHTLMVVVVAIWFITNGLFAGASTKVITPTTELIYPVKKVTTLPCRQQMKLWSELDESCKIDLPIIAWADYDKYRDTNVSEWTPYNSIYTTLRWATYKGQRDMDKWDHAWIDIASAKGTPLYAIAHGIVTFAGEQAGYGNVVKIMFSYKWDHYHAVYGHMDSIDVTKWDIVEQGQVIGKIGNSGSTFGALGGNHVHFEIDRDNAGRPAFYYDKCPALVEEKKSFTDITNGGLCRPYREKAQLDPISFIESSKGKQVASLTPLVGTVSSAHGVAIVTDEKSASKLLPEFVELKKINAAKLTQDAILFVRERDIQLVATYAKTMKLKEKWTLQVYITKKWSAKSFEWPLPAAFSILSSTNGLVPSLKSLQYLKNGTQTIDFTASKKWTHKLAITLWWQTIGVIQVTVK